MKPTSSFSSSSRWLLTISGTYICFYALAVAALPSLLTGINVANAQASEKKSIRLLPPGGQFPVGHILFDWVDSTRTEPATCEPEDFRQVIAEIWYPARADAEGKKAAYYSRLEPYRSVLDAKTINILASVQTSWIEDAAVSNNAPFGVLVFSHGWSSRSASYGTFLSNLASHGYIVVGINHPYMGTVALPDGRVTNSTDLQFPTQEYADQFYADDVIFVLDQLAGLNEKDAGGRFTGTIDMSKVVAGGHSSGFPAASGAAVRDKRIKGLVSFDAGVQAIVRREGLDVPLLLFRGETNSYTDLFFRGANIHPKGTIYDVDFFRAHRADFYDLVISGTTHTSVYDEYLFAETEQERAISIRNHKIIGRFAADFLGKVLKGSKSPILDGTETVEYTKLRLIKARR
jgi:pimeloyl-ACP methyl ester carboxylesterase